MPLEYVQFDKPVAYVELTTAGRDALGTVKDGTRIYNTDTYRNEVYVGGVWLADVPFNYADTDYFETLTIVDGEITVPGSGMYVIVAEGDEITDDLETINGGELGEAVLLIAGQNSSGIDCVITLKNSVGFWPGILCLDGGDLSLFSSVSCSPPQVSCVELVKGVVSVGFNAWFATGMRGAPSDMDYLVGGAHGGSYGSPPNAIYVGTTPGGELGGTWASPTVGATHSGSAHTLAGLAVTPATLTATNLKWPAATELTLDNVGEITVTQSHHTVDTFNDAASDEVLAINGLVANQWYLFRPADGARTVVFKHGAAPILCMVNADITLDDAHDLVLVYSPDGTLAYVFGANAVTVAAASSAALTISTQELSLAPVTQYFSGWVMKTATTLTLGTLPDGAIPVRIYLQVTTAFNSDGTDQISIGIEGDPDFFGTATDVSTTGAKTVGAGAGLFLRVGATVNAYYVAGGSAATTGKAQVVLEWIRGSATIPSY
jgi:hypothetical protein